MSRLKSDQKDFSEILLDAQKKGFAEADPSMDISGLDSAYKLDILAAVAFKVDVQVSHLTYKGITEIHLKDILYANELGFRIKLLSIGKRLANNQIYLSVRPTLISSSHPLVASTGQRLDAQWLIALQKTPLSVSSSLPGLPAPVSSRLPAPVSTMR